MRCLITRYHPRGIKKDRYNRWLKELSPSPKLLSDYREGRVDWDRFKENLISELKSNSESLNAINSLRKQAKLDNVTLLCYEKDDKPCHRYIVKELIDKPEELGKAGATPLHLKSRATKHTGATCTKRKIRKTSSSK